MSIFSLQPRRSYSVYTGSFTISSSTTIYAYATASGYSTSSTASRYCSYTLPKCATPVISARNDGSLFVYCTVSSSTPGASIYATVKEYRNNELVTNNYEFMGSKQFIFMYMKDGQRITAYATASGYSRSDTATYNWTPP